MGSKTSIEWCDKTFNCWSGCSRVSEGCKFCYAETLAKRFPKALGVWGDQGERVVASERYWQQPVKWNDEAARKGIRYRVFCGSMMDFLEDRRELIEPRRRAIRLIGRTPNLDWLILTKRPGNAPDGWRFGAILENVWFGVSVENQDRVDLLIPLLKATHPAVRFLSVEPLLEEIDLEPHLADGKIHWVIVGGESSQGKGKCRAFHLEWLESVITQCRRHNVPVFVKQLGSMPHADNRSLKLIDRKGGDMEEWPDWMRIREFPRVEQ